MKVKNSILINIALSNLLNKKLRTGLTVFGIAIGIGAIFLLLTFGIGLQRLVTNEVIGNKSIKTIDVVSSNSKIIKIDDATVERISQISEVSNVGRAYYFPGSYTFSGSESDSIVYGIDLGYQNLTYLNLVEGRLLDESDRDSVVVNKAALEGIGLSGDIKEIVGQSINVLVPLAKEEGNTRDINQNFQVVGVIDSGSGAEVFIPSGVFRSSGIDNLSQVKIGANEVEDVTEIRQQVESLGLQTTSPVDTIDQINQVFRFINFILIGFGGIGMIVAILGMFNTLTISLLERTKEIGLMVALGARSLDMRKLFMFEAMILSIAGSSLGIFLAFILGRFINLIMNLNAKSRGVQDSFELFAYPLSVVISLILFMIIVGLVVVYLPAKRAEKINPIDALRRE